MQGVEFAGPGSLAKPSRLEELFFAGIEEYWPYLNGNPVFSTKNTTASLPHLPLPVFDRALVERLIRFAAAHRWGRSSRPAKVTPEPAIASGCAKYIEEIFPKQAKRSQLAKEAGLNLTVSIELRGPGGGAWSCQWIDGELAGVRPGLCDSC